MKIVLHTRKPNKKTRQVVRKLMELIPEKSLYASSDIPKEFKIKKAALTSANLIIAIGGDGTILSTERQINGKIPILPIHTGEVGFLAELGPQSLDKKIPLLLKKKYKIEERKKLEVFLNKKSIGYALNEVAIMSSRALKTCVLEVKIDGKTFETFEGDGVIVATPTGSTAYSLSVGGPIIDPKTNAFVVSPIAPYTLKARPLVFPSTSKAEALLKEGRCYIAMDGKLIGDFSKDDKLIVKKAKNKAKLVRFGEAFYNKLDSLVR